MKTSTLLTSLAAAAALLGGMAVPAVPAAAAVDTTVLRPSALDRGANPAVPVTFGTDLLDGDLTFSFPNADGITYLGRSEGDYLVGTWRQHRGVHHRVVRVAPDDTRTTVLTDVPVYELVLSDDGLRLVRPGLLLHQDRTRVKVWSSADGSLLASREFPGFAGVVAADGQRVLLSSWEPRRTFWWNTGTDRTRKISSRVAYTADIAADRLAAFTRDPYRGGCSVVTTLSDPATTLWRSCTQAVWDFSPTGARTTTAFILTDGLGPDQIEVHRSDGKLLARYQTGYFGPTVWETDDAVLLLTHGTKHTAWVRCVLDSCELASDLVPTVQPRTVARQVPALRALRASRL